jgi:1-acyl-sn-glycerol-3-phosphate acyltransferase
VLHLFLLATLKPWLLWRYRVRITGDRSLRRLRPPFVVVSNHVNFWDPFLIGFAFRHPIHLIAADGNYRSRVMRFLMGLAGTIPKAKSRNDMESIRAMQALVHNGKAIGFFPEGQRTWDGKTRPLLPGTEKLVRILGVPVVAVRLKGAYLSKPRWASSFRRGILEIELSFLLTRSQIESRPRQELAVAIERALAFDEHRWQTDRRQSGRSTLFVGRNRARGAEQVLFLCPTCGGWDTFASLGELIRCGVCGSETYFGPSGALYGQRFRHASDWNAFQLQRLEAAIRDAPPLDGEPSVHAGPLPCVSRDATLFTGHRSRPLRRRGRVLVELTREELTLSLVTQQRALRIPLREITGLTVQYTRRLEFYSGGRLYVLRINPPGPSAYRLEQTILYCKRND